MYVFFTVTGDRKRGLITIFCIIFQKICFLKEQELRDAVRNSLISVTQNRASYLSVQKHAIEYLGRSGGEEGKKVRCMDGFLLHFMKTSAVRCPGNRIAEVVQISFRAPLPHCPDTFNLQWTLVAVFQC